VSGETLAQVAQSSYGCPLPGSVQGKVGGWKMSLLMAGELELDDI